MFRVLLRALGIKVVRASFSIIKLIKFVHSQQFCSGCVGCGRMIGVLR
jgi:hypothetical protein